MNPKDFFEIHHYRLTQTPMIEPFLLNPNAYHKQTFTLSTAANQKVHPISKAVNEPIFYVYEGKLYLVGKKEQQQGILYMGYSVQYLTYVKYKGFQEVDNLTIETSLDSLKKNRSYKQLSQTSFDNIKDGAELLIFNSLRMEEADEYALSYMMIYRIQSAGQAVQEVFRLEKKQQYIFKTLQPFESHYSMIPENFPEIYLEYQCQNISQQKLDLKIIDFKVDPIMRIEKMFDHPTPLILQHEESFKIIYKIVIDIRDKRALNNVLIQKKDQTEYDLKLGCIYLEWGECGKYTGSQKTCMVRLNPVTLRIVNQISIPRETITTIEIEAEIAHYYAPTELVLKLDEMDMKAIKIIGMSDMRLQLLGEVRSRRFKLDVIAFNGGNHSVRGIKIIDQKLGKQLPYKNNMAFFVMQQNGDPPQLKQAQAADLLDLELPQQSQQLELI